MSEKHEVDVIEKLIQAGEPPQKTVEIPRLGIQVTLRGVTSKEVYRLRREHIHKRQRRGEIVEEFDEEGFNCALIVAATVSPNWGDPRLLAHYKASEPAEVLKRVLLAGELSQLADIVLELSGFNTELTEVKN